MNITPILYSEREKTIPTKTNGSVYTKNWVVELILDLAGYDSDLNLIDTVAIEPAAGEGAFLIPMIRRLIASCQRQIRPYLDCANSLIAYEIDFQSAHKITLSVIDLMISLGVPSTDAVYLSKQWIKTGDYLLNVKKLPKANFVIGNPPYVRLENIPPGILDHYRQQYSTMKGRADLYIAFFEASLENLKQDGVCAFICADRWMFNKYGADLRRMITNKFSVEKIIEMHNEDAFENNVNAYPSIIVIRNCQQKETFIANIGSSIEINSKNIANIFKSSKNITKKLNNFNFIRTQKWFKGDVPWPCNSLSNLSLLNRLENEFESLESASTFTKIGIGVATGNDNLFITKDSNIEKSRLLPLALTADTISGSLKWSGHYLINPWNKDGLVDLRNFPNLQTYLETNKNILIKRHTAKKNPTKWYRTIDRVNYNLTDKHKIYIPDIHDKLNPVLDRGKTYPHHNLYYICSDIWNLEVLGGILLSDIAQFFINTYGIKMRGGYLRFQAQYLKRIRVPNPHAISDKEAALLIKAFREKDRNLATIIAHKLYKINKNEQENLTKIFSI